ncbi:hypothetical protein ACLSU7_12285 [Bdellovibrio sp. HCB185ZH]|uniref:hypothetical protein n=1 Tax=Bdellovibrio sp. HCB185ZH TaxID=3394235 RepID=UPI0039A64AE3
MRMLVKKSKYSARLKSNGGQAVIEYVLMLVISVSLVLMLMTQIFKPFQAFVQSFMGDYLACLLETGELPQLGADTLKESECKFSFQGVSGNNSNSSNTGKSNSSNSSSSSSSDASSSKSSSSSSSSSGTYAGSSSRPRGSNSISSARAPKQGVSGNGDVGGGKVIEITLEGGGAGTLYKAKNGSSYVVEGGRRVASLPISGMTEEDRKKLEKRAESGKKSTVVSSDMNTKPKKTAVKKPEARTVAEAAEEPVTFGNFIRWLFIAALIIALVIFLGGQALQFSKSGEK